MFVTVWGLLCPPGKQTEMGLVFLEANVRRKWIEPILVAVVGSLLAVAAVPAAAVDGVVDHPAEYSACIGPAAESAGFRDMKRNFAESAADCLAYYGITKGTSTGIFSPDDVVPRWQMALFLVRAAGPAGIVVPKASDQGFTDLEQLGPSTRDAINQLAALRIMEGTSASTFAPSAMVTRQQMAALLSRFLKAAPTGPGGSDIDDVKPDDNNFRDLGPVPFITSEDIRRLYEMGVTGGTSSTTFSPGAPVSRAQMAVFITRMLAHTNARPAGLTIQIADQDVFKNSDIRLAISLRDSDRRPFEGRLIDIFDATDPTEAFDQNGACTDHVTPAVGGDACTIDVSDMSTDNLGNVVVDVEIANVKRLRIWVWTDEKGEVFDEDSAEPLVLDLTPRSGASALEVSDDLPPTARKVEFGDSVTFTFRMIDDDGDPVARQGVSFTVQVNESRDNGRSFERTTITKETGPYGGTQLTFRFTDPSSSPGDIAKLDLDVQNSGGFKVTDKTTTQMVDDDGTNDDSLLDWSDERREPTTLKLTLTKEFRTASADGAGAGTTVRAALTDQFGGPVAREQIVFTSNDSNGVPDGVRRTSNPQGVATLNYQRDDSGRGIETITGKFGRLVGTARQYWVTPISGSVNGSGSVRVVNRDTNTIVVAGRSVAEIIEYDDNDRYLIDDDPATVGVFEAHLSVGDILTYEITDPKKSTVNSFSLTNR